MTSVAPSPEQQGETLNPSSPSKLDSTQVKLRGLLHRQEYFWRDHQQWLASCGYQLRPRYMPDWVPSWDAKAQFYSDYEDGIRPLYNHLMDATRKSDGAFVMLKRIITAQHPEETEITRFFSTEPLASDPSNHCVPLYDVLQIPDDPERSILVIPLLRPFDDPRFDTIGEAVDFFGQIFEGLSFMHKHHVAHRDCMDLNIMMDASPMYPEPFHPFALDMKRDRSGKVSHFTRTQRPPKYYLIDFGISRRYNLDDGPPIEHEPILGGDHTAPELQRPNAPHNPFPTDVYYLGNVIKEQFIQRSIGFDFMIPLVNDMVQEDPAKRPTIDEVIKRFEVIMKGLSGWKLRSRVIRRKDWMVFGFFRTCSHWSRRLGFIAGNIHPIPIHKS